MTLYGVVTMDIIGSRNIWDRRELQDKLIQYIDIINEKYRDILAVPIGITLGDEWQLITTKPASCYDLVHEFQQLLWKDKINFYSGIGIGEISTNCYSDIRRMDGPCFHMAREAVNIAKKQIKDSSKYIYSKQNNVYFKCNDGIDLPKAQRYSIKENTKNIILPELEEAAVTSNTEDETEYMLRKTLSLDHVINIIIENNEILKSKMTEKQKIVYVDYLKYGTYRNMIIHSDYPNESIGGISQKLNSAEFFTIQRNHRMVSCLIDYFCAIKEVRN